MHRPIFLAVAALSLAVTPATANPFIAPSAIDAAVAGFLGAPAGTPGGAARAVDPRLKLADCTDGLEVAWYGRSGSTLQVSCAAHGWRVFVPVGHGGDASARGNPAGEAIVQKGETVSLTYEGTGFTLTRQGEALEPGAHGQWIRIKPVGDNAKPVRGQVVGPGNVHVSAG